MFLQTQPTLDRLFSQWQAADLADPQPLILYGLTGCGKRTYLRAFLRSFYCREPLGFKPFAAEPFIKECTCESCERFRLDRHPDFLALNGNEGIAEVREALDEFLSHNPSMLRQRYLLLGNLHTYDQNILDALLKTIEETPPHVTVLATAATPRSLPPAVPSRFRTYQFESYNVETMERLLKPHTNVQRLLTTLSGNVFLADSKTHPILQTPGAYQMAARFDFPALYDRFYTNLDLISLTALTKSTLENFRTAKAEFPFIDLYQLFLNFALHRCHKQLQLNASSSENAATQLAQFEAIVPGLLMQPGRYLQKASTATFLLDLEAVYVLVFRFLYILRKSF